jgi:hypothetical protein
MSTNVYRFSTDGTALMTYLVPVPASQAYQVISVTCHFNAAPVSAEDFTITLDNASGPGYDILLYTVDPSVGAVTDILWQPDEELDLVGGDAVLVQYDNTDARNYGVQVTLKAV